MARGDYKCIYQIWKVININLHREMYIKKLKSRCLKMCTCSYLAYIFSYEKNLTLWLKPTPCLSHELPI